MSPPLNPDWWYIHGRAYDFSDFIPVHPGGWKAINLGKGIDCTELFERCGLTKTFLLSKDEFFVFSCCPHKTSYHTHLPDSRILEKYKVTKSHSNYALQIENSTYSFEENGFYRTLKEQTREYFRFCRVTRKFTCKRG